MRFRQPREDALSSAFGARLLVLLFPLVLVIALVRGDAPAWFYVAWILGGVGAVLFTFVLLPNYQDWFAGKDLGSGDDDG